jgi:alpha-beta hydrolase superfamily lysophospholipase
MMILRILLIALLVLLLALLAWLFWPNGPDRFGRPDIEPGSLDRQIGQQMEQKKFELPEDREGPVQATLLHLAPDTPSQKAVLYIHGYGDYFFQLHEAQWYATQGYHFYALDLRKYGRSLLPHQQPNYVADLRTHFEEIDQAIRQIIDEDGRSWLLLYGHSNGGLISTLYAAEGEQRGRLDALLLNSPFLDQSLSDGIRLIFPLINGLSRLRPSKIVRQEGLPHYARTIHADYEGDWDYTKAWKPDGGFPVFLGWFAAVMRAQKKVAGGLDLELPVLLLHSDSSYTYQAREYHPAMKSRDMILDVEDMKRLGPGLGKNVQLAEVPDAMHDVFLSPPEVREVAFAKVRSWLKELEKNGQIRR